MDDKPALNSIGAALYRYAYFMTQSQDLSESIVCLVLDRARMMLSHTQHRLPLIWLVKMLREHYKHLQLDDEMNTKIGEWYFTESYLNAPFNYMLDKLGDDIIQLPLYLREVLVLQIVFGMSIQDIAWLLGSTTLSIEKRIFDAKRMIFHNSVVIH